jgi:hypothetical protein
MGDSESSVRLRTASIERKNQEAAPILAWGQDFGLDVDAKNVRGGAASETGAGDVHGSDGGSMALGRIHGDARGVAQRGISEGVKFIVASGKD